jgi:alkylation response protein AidB-like acyl-CoA dehydrogenase
MDFRFTPAEEAWRQELRSFLRQELPQWYWEEGDPEDWTVSEEAWEFASRFVRRLGQKGWLAVAWPKEWGGQERSYIEQTIFAEEMAYHRAPLGRASMGTRIVGPTIIVHGTDEQKREYLPPIAAGEVVWCQGFSEPNAGSDLASLQTRAVADGDDFVITGTKIWTSGAHKADYCLLAARTNPDAPKHRGISLFIVPMKMPGITVVPVIDMRDAHYFNQVFFDGVRVPRRNMVGQQDRGWYAMVTTLDFERSGVERSAEARRVIEELVEYARTTTRNGRPLAADPVVRHRLADLAIETEVARMLAYRVASMQARGLIPNYESSMSKLFGSELSQRVASTGLKLLGQAGVLVKGSKWAKLKGRLQWIWLESFANTIRAGTSEIQRNIIAVRGLGLPR